MSATATYGQQSASTSIPPISNAIQDERRERNKRALCWLGSVEIFLGLISCVLGAITLGEGPRSNRYYYDHTFPKTGQGIWCGLLLIISGILGVTARFRPTKLMYRANLALSILAVLAMVTLLLISSIASAIDSHMAFHIVLAVTALVGIIISSIHCGYSFIERSTKRRRDGRVMYRSVPQQQLIPVQMPNGQIVYYPSQTIPSTSLYPMTFPNANQPLHPTQFIYPSTSQNGCGPAFPAYNIPMAYYPPTVPIPQPVYSNSPQGGITPNFQPRYGMPTSAVPAGISSPQVPVTQHTQQSSSSPPVVNSDNPPAYSL